MMGVKKIDASETMDSCAILHNIAYNNIERDESRQEEDKKILLQMRKGGQENRGQRI
jgi:hypothetical protein